MANDLITADVMAAIAARINARKSTLGLEGVSYPALNTVPSSPWAMVRQSMAMPSYVTKARAGVQVVRPQIDIVLLIRSDEKRPGDAARLDGLPEMVLDLFDANANGGNVNSAFTGLLRGNVDRIWNEAQVRRLAVSWGETGYCHAAIITMDAEFQRKAVLL